MNTNKRLMIKKGVGKGGHKKSYLSNCTGAHSKKKFRNLIIIMKIISKGSIIILAILYNYYIHPQGDFQRNYTELYRHFRKHRKKNKCRNIATTGMT